MSKVVIFLTYYEILNVKQTASEKEIKNAYRVLAKKYHPDTYQGNKNIAEDKMKQINEAYDVLSNKESKTKYDEQFKSPITENTEETSYQKAYYNYETEEYRSPDPREADYRNYYNYSPDYDNDFDYEKDYDFTRLKALLEKSVLKFSLFVVFILVMIGILIYMINQIKIQAANVFEPIRHKEQPSVVEYVPQNQYKAEIPNKEDNQINNSQMDTEELEKQLQNLEKSFNEWYEQDGKMYEQQIKEGINSFYQELINNVKNN